MTKKEAHIAVGVCVCERETVDTIQCDSKMHFFTKF